MQVGGGYYLGTMSPFWFLIGVCVVAVAGIVSIFWAWYRALHDERGPALIATAVTVAAFFGLLFALSAVVKPPPPPQSNTESWE